MKLIFAILRSLNPLWTERMMAVNYRTASNVPDGVDARGNPKRIILPKQLLVSVTETTFMFGWNVYTKNTNMTANEIFHGEFEAKAAIVKEVVDTDFPWASEFFKNQLERARNTVLPDDPEHGAYFAEYYTFPA